MKRLLVGIFALAVAAPTFAAEPSDPLAAARKRWLRGNHAEARALYEKLAADAKHHVAAVIGLSRVYQDEGEYDKALAVVADALTNESDAAHPDLLARKGEVLYDRGRWGEALAAAEAALKAKPEHFPARWVRARILRDRGDLQAADAEMRWFVRTYTRRSNADQEIKDADELLIVGQAGAENARWHNLSDQFRFILNEVYADALKYDADQWRAEYLAGAMLLEKYNRPDAVAAFDNALKINPRAAEALVGKGQAALQTFEMKDAEQFADRALKVNPNLTAALRLKADVRLAGDDLDLAVKLLERAKAVNPREEATLARLAACHHLLKQPDQFAALVAEVEKFDPKPGVFYYELGSCLEDRRLYGAAEEHFQKAVKLRPNLPGPSAGLGMLYLRLGKEAESRKLLDRAFKNDPFNIRVANSLKVLRHLEKYETVATKHFDLRFDPKTDRVLAAFLADYLEAEYEKLAKQFGYEPGGRILIEVFNSHEMFSGRTVALPDLHTIGACTGRVVTMASPRGKGVGKPFNWGRVIRHELVHIFNLAQTDFQVPHWLTEGLAVGNEGYARPPSWSLILRERFDGNDLLSLDTIQLGFVRPRSPSEWTLAYCQSQLYVEYLVKAHGPDAVGKMLNAYRDGLTTAAAIRKVCGVGKDEFEKGYRAYVAEVVRSVPSGRPAAKPMTLAELEKAHKENPDNPDLAARLADQYSRRRRAADARKLAEAVLKAHPNHAQASLVKARLLNASGDVEGARSVLEAALKAHPDEPRLIVGLGRMCVEAKEFAQAATLFERGRKVAPFDGDWPEALREIYEKVGQKEKLASVLRELAANDADDLKTRLKLAQLLLDDNKPADAEEVAREALRIDVLNETAQKLLLKALEAQNKADDAAKLTKRFGG